MTDIANTQSTPGGDASFTIDAQETKNGNAFIDILNYT